MELLIVRHADAGDAEEFAKSGRPDSERPLSPKGRRQMRAAARAIAELVPTVDLLVTSPYTRAAQTQEIVAQRYGDGVTVATSVTLEPERAPEEFAKWLRRQDAETVAAIGHEPHLGALVTWFMSGSADSRVELKKGGACLLRFDGRPDQGAATLAWLLTARQLRTLAGRM